MGFFIMHHKTRETLEKVVDSTLDTPMHITVELNHGSAFWKLLQKWGIRPVKRVFEFTPITTGNLIRISRILLRIDPDIMDAKRLLESTYKALATHGDDICEVVAIAIANSKAGPSKSLVSLVRDEFTPKELLSVLSLTLNRMNVSDFVNSIILMRGLNVLESEPRKEQKKKVSPSDPGR
jgi:hypothetical protein